MSDDDLAVLKAENSRLRSLLARNGIDYGPCIWTPADATGQVARVVADLDAIDGDDPEQAHGKADDLLLAAVPSEVQEAYGRVLKRCRWWACA